jgi:D-3-phosphoglycerate dehydrogenase
MTASVIGNNIPFLEKKGNDIGLLYPLAIIFSLLYNFLIKYKYFFFDFDSTFVTTESLEQLAEISLKNNPQKKILLKKITSITQKAMEGKITFSQSLEKRLTLFKPRKEDITHLISKLKKQITPSILRNKAFFNMYKEYIYIISGGFIEFISPIVKPFGIDENHILANEFIFNDKDVVIGYNKNNPLAGRNGKAEAIKKLALNGDIYIIGDGYTDYLVRKSHVAHHFIVLTENIERSQIIQKADKIVHNFDEFLYFLDYPRSLSYPKSKIKVLLLENIHENATLLFQKEGYVVESLPHSLNEEDLIKKVQDITILGVRSRVQITESVLHAAKKLLVIGTFSIGTNHINLPFASEKGIAVFNAPYSSTRSVVELVLGEILMLLRKTIDKNNKLHQGIWDKTAKGSHEIRGKKLGIIGYGNIGSQLGILAEMLGIEVYFYDIIERPILGNAKKCESLEDVLKISDIISVHVDGRKENKNLIGKKEFSIMKNHVIFINASRGFIVDVEALSIYIKNGKIDGVAIDVFPTEPKSNNEVFHSPLIGLPNTILTPHIGGSTEEAQKNIADFIAEKIIQFINTGTTMLSVNLPHLQLPDQKGKNRFIHIHKNIPGVLSQINSILSQNNCNLSGQYLKTTDDIGFVISDIDQNYSKGIIKQLKTVLGTIRVRVLY